MFQLDPNLFVSLVLISVKLALVRQILALAVQTTASDQELLTVIVSMDILKIYKFNPSIVLNALTFVLLVLN
jgi:hypothetical protein